MQAQQRPAFVQRARAGAEGFTQHRCHAARQFGRAVVPGDAGVVAQAEANIRARQRRACQHVIAVGVFGALGLEELASRRGIEIQVGHFHRGATGVCRRLHGQRLTAFATHAPGMACGIAAADDGHACYGSNRSQRLTAKAQ